MKGSVKTVRTVPPDYPDSPQAAFLLGGGSEGSTGKTLLPFDPL